MAELIAGLTHQIYEEGDDESITISAPTSAGAEDMGEQRLLREERRHD